MRSPMQRDAALDKAAPRVLDRRAAQGITHPLHRVLACVLIACVVSGCATAADFPAHPTAVWGYHTGPPVAPNSSAFVDMFAEWAATEVDCQHLLDASKAANAADVARRTAQPMGFSTCSRGAVHAGGDLNRTGYTFEGTEWGCQRLLIPSLAEVSFTDTPRELARATSPASGGVYPLSTTRTTAWPLPSGASAPSFCASWLSAAAGLEPRRAAP